MQVSSWLFFFSNCLYIIACILPFFHEYAGPHSVFNAEVGIGYAIITSISSLLFMDGSIYFVRLSYPENFLRMMEKLASNSEDQSISCLNRYFDSDSVLRPFSTMFLGTCVLFIYPFYGLAIGELTLVNFAVSVAAASFFVWFFIFWLNSYRNVNKNNGEGTKYVYDCVVCFAFGFCFRKSSLRMHLAPDPLASAWIFSAICTILFIGCVMYIAISVSWLTILGISSCLPLMVGSYLLLYSTYPGNMTSSCFYDSFLNPCECCCNSCARHQRKKQVHFADTENLALTSFHADPYIGYNSLDQFEDDDDEHLTTFQSLMRGKSCRCIVS